MARILRMEKRHLEEVRDVDHRVWAHYQSARNLPSTPPRTAANVRVNWEGDSDGCFVAEAEGRVVGYIFSHTWGAVGWVGVFGVLPDLRGRGVGKALLAAAVEYLRGAGCATIGLETMPDETYNLGLYMKAGFRPASHTFLLARPVTVAPVPSPVFLTRWESLGSEAKMAAMQAVADISSAVVPGLDHRKIAKSLALNHLGRVVMFGRETWTGFAAICTTSKVEGLSVDTARVEALCLLPGAAPFLREVVASLEQFAARLGFAKLGFWLNSEHWDAVRTLLSAGYRVAHTRLRMMLVRGTAIRGGLEGSTWAM